MNAFAPLLAMALLGACSSMNTDTATGSPDRSARDVSSRPFGFAKHGPPATLWTLRGHGIEVDVTDHGATLVAVRTPDRAGFLGDIVLGFDDVSGYESDDNQYFGCTAGRVCNRIRNGEFTLDGYTYVLATNNGPNHLHGGAVRSFDKVHWHGEAGNGSRGPSVRFTYLSRDGEEGYPGNLQVAVTYRVVQGPGLEIDFEATTDHRTPVNLTNHAYWNLAGAGAPTVLDHTLWIDAPSYTPTDDTLIPTGAIAPVAGTPLDFREQRPIWLYMDQLEKTPALGYDHNYVLRGASELRPVARLAHTASGRSLTLATTEPGLQFYSGNYLHGQAGKRGATYAKHSAVCLEPQHFPDSVNHPNFPNTILDPGQTYSSRMLLTFRTE
ncbi:MAG TPA: aldose epimerase family protein [Planctomycetota bacterium]|nr:aldose epimerase family protein [Planctomycetota bacterium]